MPNGARVRVRWLALVPSMAMFTGFACLFALQHSLKSRLDIPDDDSAKSFAFSYCVSALYWGQVVFRFGHQYALRPLAEGERTRLALAVMAAVQLSLTLLWWRAGGVSLWLVFLCYLTGGAALGVFEGNFVQLLGQSHPEAKLHGISGIPVGIFLVVVMGFGLMGFGVVTPVALYAVAGLGCVGGVAVMSRLTAAGPGQVDEEEEVWSPVVESAMRSSPRRPPGHLGGRPRSSMKLVAVSSLVYLVNMSIVSGWSPGVLLYVYNSEYIQVKYLGYISTSLFFSLFSSFGCVADLVSRKLVYLWALSTPTYFLILTMAGVGVLATQDPAIAPLGTMLVFLGNGSIYASSCRLIDALGDPEVVTQANSLFFAAGDVGSILGASLIPHLRSILSHF